MARLYVKPARDVKSYPEIAHITVRLMKSWNVRPNGALPSDTHKNPIEQVQAINLRSEKALEEVPPKKYASKEVFERLVPQPKVEVEKKDNKHRQGIKVRPPLPFLQWLQKSKDESKYKTFLYILSQVRMNLPLIEVLQEVPRYAKYLRDIVANKRRLTEFETVALTKECSARVQSNIPLKLKDLGCFTIPLVIGKYKVGRALCDLGARIYLMPLSVFKQFELGTPRPTTITLQLIDRSLAVLE
uniref:Uncharacterized protein n=2 Tax=Nicotiana TaxID=4085 RepID=A0A1S4CXS0_TOBAC|nr:PREDICTED: uncharacterized protein LOC104247126 [Nicotiana sylvestris]XP_016505950.1 PREDICTED: uncharacterized protein LOC107823759 [Nicotiana tabacum]